MSDEVRVEAIDMVVTAVEKFPQNYEVYLIKKGREQGHQGEHG